MISLLKVGHFTMDNASNNATFMECLATELAQRDISFDAADRQIACFEHVVNLCSGQVTRVASVQDDEHGSSSFDDGIMPSIVSSPVGLARAAVQAIRGSGTRRDAFHEVIEDGNKKEWFKGQDGNAVKLPNRQLLRDVKTRWDSVYQMIGRLRQLRPVCSLLFELY